MKRTKRQGKMSKKNNDTPPKKGRPEKFMRFHGTPEELAQALFARAKPPDPSKRVHNRAPGKKSR